MSSARSDTRLSVNAVALVEEMRAGDTGAGDRLFGLLYDELRGLARRVMRGERPGHTLQPTALVHEAYLRLMGSAAEITDRAHFMAVAARVMRRLLVDHARARGAAKRGGDLRSVTLDEALAGAASSEFDVGVFDAAMTALEELDARKARWIELRHLAGLTTAEIAALDETSERTVRRELQIGRAWLRREIEARA